MLDVQFSTNLSIFIQIITGLLSIQGIFIPLPDQYLVIREILVLEIIVQIVELFFYFFFLRSMTSTALPQMAATRYFDWVITTPTMLLTTIIFFKYQEHIENFSKKEKLTFWGFIKENKKNIFLIFLSNFLMLLFGYLGEIQAIRMDVSLVLGFFFFAYTFYIIYSEYAINSKQSLKMFYFILFIWGLYGVVATFNIQNKNHSFNILDIFAKNFFGVYLYFKILSIKQHKK
jgi:hypothetical protein